jgi:putative oxidoreductase
MTETAASTRRRLLRSAVGVMFIAHALLKYFVFTLPGTAQFFRPSDCRERSAT